MQLKIIDNISRWFGYIGIGVTVALMLLIVTDVFLRFAFNSPIKGSIELVSMTMIGLTLGMALTALRGRHIIAEIIPKRFSTKIQFVVDGLVLLATLVIYVIITWRAVLETIDEWRSQYTVSLVLPIPMYIYWGIYCLALIALCLAIITIIVNKFRRVEK